MDYWSEEVIKVETKCNTLAKLNPVMFEDMKIHILTKYVDDCFMAVNVFRLEVRWDQDSKAMVWTSHQEQQDREVKINMEKVTMEEISKMAGTVLGCLRFTFDTPSMNPTNTMPVLDTQIWMKQEERETGIPADLLKDRNLIQVKTGALQRVVVYKFYQKPMVHRVANLSRSASPENQKVTT